MSCNCISKSEEKIREHLKEQHPDWEIITGSYNNKTFIFEGPNQGVVLTNEFESTYTKPNGDGSRSKSKKHIVQLFAQYCPFCGSKMVENKEGEDHPDTILEYVQKLNSLSAKKDGTKFTVALHSNASPTTFTIWLHIGELKREIAIGLERHVVVSILKTLANLYSNEL